MIKIADKGATIFAIFDSFYYKLTGNNETQRAVSQQIRELFQISEESFTETVYFDVAELHIQNTRFDWLTNKLNSPKSYSAKNMLGIVAQNNSLVLHGDMRCVEIIKFDDQTEPLRKESQFPAFVIREFNSGGIFIYACFTLRKIENYKQILKNLYLHQATALNNVRQDEPEVVNFPVDTMDFSSKTEVVTSYIFISYRRSDSADIAGRIYDRLVDRFGRNPIFKDVDSIPLGSDFKEYIDRVVGECKVLLAIIGDRWLDARDASGKKRLEDPLDFVRTEIESALERNILVIPLLVRSAEMPHEEQLPSRLRKLASRNGISIRPDPDFHRDMDRLISALEKYFNTNAK